MIEFKFKDEVFPDKDYLMHVSKVMKRYFMRQFFQSKQPKPVDHLVRRHLSIKRRA